MSTFRVEVVKPSANRPGRFIGVDYATGVRSLRHAAEIALRARRTFPTVHIVCVDGPQPTLVAACRDGVWTDRGGHPVTSIGGVEV